MLAVSLLKNIFGVEIGQRMIVAEIIHLARQYIGDVGDCEMSGNSGHRCV